MKHSFEFGSLFFRDLFVDQMQVARKKPSVWERVFKKGAKQPGHVD